MAKHNPQNERIKREYFAYLKEAFKQSAASVDAAAKALSRFEENTQFKDFRRFRVEQVIAFKDDLRAQTSLRSGKELSAATLKTTLSHLKRFFLWLAGQPGYRSRIAYSDADYFNPSEREDRIANARRERPAPTLDQVHFALSCMPSDSDIALRDRAVLAFALLTGARDGAIASMTLGLIDLERKCVHQDARTVKTKYSKTYTTYFFPVGGDALRIFSEWLEFLRARHWGDEDPLFPSTRTAIGPSGRFEVAGLSHAHWANAGPIRAIFKSAFSGASLPYFNPHSLRKTLTRLAESRCRSPEEFKAWSQNLGHEGVLTTFQSYGSVSSVRQCELIGRLGSDFPQMATDADVFAEAVARRLAQMPFAESLHSRLK